MQERYLGDIHDFQKFIFLKFLSSELQRKIGLNWFLVNPKSIGETEIKKKDGEKRYYLLKNKYKILDKKIFNELEKVKLKKNRSISYFCKNSHLKKNINFFNQKLTPSDRKNWYNESLKCFKNEKIIFLDPDNGLAKKKKSLRQSLKYVLIDEIQKYIDEEKTIIFTQFQSFNKLNLLYLQEIKQFLKKKDININIPIIRNKTAPNTFYISITNDKKIELKLKKKIEKYCRIYKDIVELITI